MSREDEKSPYAGYRWLKFRQDLHDIERWDLAWDVDRKIKSEDRPNVPRILEAIRLDSFGWPVCASDDCGNRFQKVIASYYDKTMMKLIQAVYDPNYRDIKYRYRIESYNHNPGTNDFAQSTSTQYDSLHHLLDSLSSFWAGTENPMKYVDLKRPIRISKDIPDTYKQAGFGVWA